MAFYHKLGEFPQKKHIAFYKDNGKDLYREELVSTRGFSGVYSNKYHIHMPTKALSIKEAYREDDYKWKDAPLKHLHFFTGKANKSGDFVSSRIPFLYNDNCLISTATPDEEPKIFFKNAYFHEFIFVHHGRGTFLSDYGKIELVEGDQLIIPRGTIYQIIMEKNEGNKLLIVESDTPYDFPKHFINEYGQLLEDAPLSERDIKLPEYIKPKNEKGEFPMLLKASDRTFEYILPYHPFDVVGWDGYLYPFAFNINDYEPKVGKIHLPPPVHLLFTTQSFVLCNFCPRPYDFHPQAIPAPYYHANVDSAEVLYYADGDFMSRKGITEGSITLHPLGIPHGPQPGKTEASIGAKETNELAVMIDTFKPLYPTKYVQDVEDQDYYRSWIVEEDE